jgi:hypothetical protein
MPGIAQATEAKVTAHYVEARDEVEFGIRLNIAGGWAVVCRDGSPRRFASESDAELEATALMQKAELARALLDTGADRG